LTLIAELYNTSVGALEAINDGALRQGPDVLEIGSTLLVPLEVLRAPPLPAAAAAAAAAAAQSTLGGAARGPDLCLPLTLR
jgi:hypothetical protein